MALMLIDTRDDGDDEPSRPPRRRRRSPIDWPLWWWSFESVALFVAAASLAGFVAVALAFAGLFAMVRALDHFCGGSGFGLKDHHQ